MKYGLMYTDYFVRDVNEDEIKAGFYRDLSKYSYEQKYAEFYELNIICGTFREAMKVLGEYKYLDINKTKDTLGERLDIREIIITEYPEDEYEANKIKFLKEWVYGEDFDKPS